MIATALFSVKESLFSAYYFHNYHDITILEYGSSKKWGSFVTNIS